MKKIGRTFGVAVVAALALAGCGGGGGDTGSASAVQNLQSAPTSGYQSYVESSHQTTLSAKDSAGNSYTLNYSWQPTGQVTSFRGVNASTAVETIAVSENGVLLTNQIDTAYYVANPYTPLGLTVNGSSLLAVFTNTYPLPSTITVGQAGPFVNGAYYHDSTLQIEDAAMTQTFSVSANNSTTLLACLNQTSSAIAGNPDGFVNSTESVCYTFDSSGNIKLSSLQITVSGITLNFS